MTGSDLWQAPDLVPSLPCQDVAKAVAWLERVFGFRERTEARLSWPGGTLAWMETGGALFSLTTPDPTLGISPSPTPSVLMKVYVDDVNAHFAHAEAEGAKIVSGLEDGFWGGRIYRVLDCEGHLWEFSQRGRDLPAEQWRLPPGVGRGL